MPINLKAKQQGALTYLAYLALAYLLIFSPQQAEAQEKEAPITLTRNHLLRLNVAMGQPDLVGISVGLTLLNPIEIEGGVGMLPYWSATFARVGYVRTLFDGRDETAKGWVHQVGGFVGYRRIVSSTGVINFYHLATAQGRYEITRWVSPDFGLNATVNLGRSYKVAGDGPEPWLPDAWLGLGLRI